MRSAISGPRHGYIVHHCGEAPTVRVDPSRRVPDHQLIVFARDDDYFFGVLHSRAHEVWSLRMGTWLGVGNDPRYTPTTCFETFPLPWPPGQEPAEATPTTPGRRHRRRRRRPRRQAPPLARSPRRHPRPAQETHPHQPLQRPPHLARPRPRRPRPRRLVRLRLAPGRDPATVPEETILERLLALNGERAATIDGKGKSK